MREVSTRRTVKPRKRAIVIEEAGVRVRIFQRADSDRYWLDVWNGPKRERTSADTTDLRAAKAKAVERARAVARQQLLGVRPDTLTLGQVFEAYHQHKGMNLNGQWKKAAITRRRLFLAAWGDSTRVASISQTSVDKYSAGRRRAYAARRPSDTADTPPRVLRDGALDCDFRWLSSVFNWATRHKLPDGTRLLSLNPLHDCQWPREKNENVLRPRATLDRYVRTIAKANDVDPSGRLRCAVALAWHTGRRESAILALRADDLLLSEHRIAAAHAKAGRDEARAKAMPHGAIRWPSETDKMGVLHITAISPEARAEIDRYLSLNPRVGDVPLFPSKRKPGESLSRHTAIKWLMEVEALAGLHKLHGGAFHPYRRAWATDRKHINDKTVAAAGGWKSTKTLAIYQGVDAADELAAVLNAPVGKANTA